MIPASSKESRGPGAAGVHLLLDTRISGEDRCELDEAIVITLQGRLEELAKRFRLCRIQGRSPTDLI